MAKSFGVTNDEANELVQQMYIRIDKYVESKNKILYKEDEVNTFYVYVTLRNLYLSRFHKITGSHFVIDPDVDAPHIDHNMEAEERFNALVDKIDLITSDWYWYDKKLWDVYFYWSKSMRSIAKETRISLSSIFNTLTNGKAKVKSELKEEYEEYKRSRED
jgi:DNA-directed RNA polymerase specialized sigma24 family protein